MRLFWRCMLRRIEFESKPLFYRNVLCFNDISAFVYAFFFLIWVLEVLFFSSLLHSHSMCAFHCDEFLCNAYIQSDVCVSVYSTAFSPIVCSIFLYKMHEEFLLCVHISYDDQQTNRAWMILKQRTHSKVHVYFCFWNYIICNDLIRLMRKKRRKKNICKSIVNELITMSAMNGEKGKKYNKPKRMTIH